MPAIRHLKDKERKQLQREFIERYPTSEKFLQSGSAIEEQIVGDDRVFLLDGKPRIVRTKFGLFPSLKFDDFVNSLPIVVVDMGAVAHVANGANVMRPGIREIRNDFGKGALLLIVDEKFGKHIALGLADMDSGAMRSMDKGKVVVNVHYVGDELWKSFPGS